jgi:hypothetical protein
VIGFAYQIPAYYWALRTMIERGSVNVNSDDVIKVINKSRKLILTYATSSSLVTKFEAS